MNGTKCNINFLNSMKENINGKQNKNELFVWD